MKRWAAIVIGAALVAGPTQATASDHRPPETHVRFGGENVQQGNLGSHCWSGEGVAWCADSAGYNFPRTGRYVPADKKLRMRVRYATRPLKISIASWTKVDADRQPVGGAKLLHTELKAVRRNGKVVAWDAIFKLPKPGQHYFLNAFIRWGNDAEYEFHLKTRE